MSNQTFNPYRTFAGDTKALRQIKVLPVVIKTTQVCKVCHATYEVAKFDKISLCSKHLPQ